MNDLVTVVDPQSVHDLVMHAIHVTVQVAVAVASYVLGRRALERL